MKYWLFFLLFIIGGSIYSITTSNLDHSSLVVKKNSSTGIAGLFYLYSATGNNGDPSSIVGVGMNANSTYTGYPYGSLLVNVPTLFTKTVSCEEVRTTTDATTTSVTIDWTRGNNQRLAIGTNSNFSITFNGYTNIGYHGTLLITYTHPLGCGAITWGTGTFWFGGSVPVLTRTQGSVDIINFFRHQDGTSTNNYCGYPAYDFR